MPHTPTYERLVPAARKAGLAGSTVLKGVMGFGSHGVIENSTWSLVQHVPVIVEIVDTGQRIAEFVQGPLEQLMVRGMATLERANVMLFRERSREEPTRLELGGPLAALSTLPRIRAGGHVKVDETGVLLRVFIGESDKFERLPLYEAIVQKVRELGLAGATVLRGIEGFGVHSVVHKASLLNLS